MLGLT